MTTIRFRICSLLALLGAACLAPVIAEAAWPHDPSTDFVALTAASGAKVFPVALADGAGGAFVAWFQYGPNSADIAVQHVSGTGALLWGPNAVTVTNLPGDQYSPTIASDGAGGVFLTWIDQRNIGTTGNDIYAQRVNAAGVPQWISNGLPICTFTGHQWYPQIAADGTGGAFITWWDDRTGGSDIYVQRVNASGTPQMTTNGVGICLSAGDQIVPVIAPDGAGGAIVAWQDGRGAFFDIFAQRVNGIGASSWDPNGVRLCFTSGQQDYPAIVSDGAGGAIVAWRDFRSGSGTSIYAEHVSNAGLNQSGSTGFPVCVAFSPKDPPAITTDGSGGAIMAWGDSRGPTKDIYAQRLGAGGTMPWTTDGVAVCNATQVQSQPQIAPDGAGGAILTWQDYRSIYSYDIYAQRLNAAGAPLWLANGAPISTGTGNQQAPVVAGDGAGGAIITWYDDRSGIDEMHANRIGRFGQLGSPEPAIASVRDVPNDQGGQVKVSWYASYLDQGSDPNLASYDVYRSAPGSLAAAAIRAGARRLTSFAEAPRPGERAFVMSPATTDLYAWEYLSTVDAVHFLSAYGAIEATTSDSIGGSNPRTAFMVVGRNSNGSMYWLSAPDSGYSVDNLAPATPSPFTGQYAGGTTTLHWGRNSELDLASYSLYHGTSPSFVPAPGNLVTSQFETDYIDHAGQPYFYKLAAIDSHGNLSGFALLQPQGTTGVPEAASAARLELSPASPNPAVGGATFHFSLPREGRMTLALFDEQGRRVRDLAGGTLPAGEHVAKWDGRDNAGAPVPAGLYFCRLEAGREILSRRLAVIH